MYEHKPYKHSLNKEGIDVTEIAGKKIAGNRVLFGTMRAYSTLAGQEVTLIELTDEKGELKHLAFTNDRIDQLYKETSGSYNLPEGSRIVTTESILPSLLRKKIGHHTLR